jgi:hypothetical protein
MSWQTIKEAYAVRRIVPPSSEMKAQIEQLLSVGVDEKPRESLSEGGSSRLLRSGHRRR